MKPFFYFSIFLKGALVLSCIQETKKYCNTNLKRLRWTLELNPQGTFSSEWPQFWLRFSLRSHAFCQKEPKDSRDGLKHLCRIYNITINPKVEAVSPVSLFPRLTLFCTCNKNTVNVCFFLSVPNPNKTEHSHLWLPLCQFPLACEEDTETTRATS